MENLAFVTQVVSEVPPQILANSSFWAVFCCFDGRELDAVQRALSLEWDQRAALSRLPKQVCLVKYANPAFPTPFLVRVCDCQIALPQPDEIQRRERESLSGLSFVPLEQRGFEEKPNAKKAADCMLMTSKTAQDYLIEIGKDQLKPASRRHKELGVPGSSGTALRKELLQAGLIELHEVNTYGPLRKIKNTVISDKGYAFLKSLGISCERPRGKGGWEHVWHQHSIAAWARANRFEAFVEDARQEKSVDVSLTRDGRRIAVEVLRHGVRKEMANIRDLHAYSEIWFCGKDLDEARKLQLEIHRTFQEAAPAILQRVKFKLFREFQDRTPAQNATEAEGGNSGLVLS